MLCSVLFRFLSPVFFLFFLRFVLQVNKRPGLDPFLEALARDYNTIVFTAAMPDYAGPVLDYIDPKGTLFHQRLYRSSCRQVTQTSTIYLLLRTAYTFLPSVEIFNCSTLSL